MRPAKAGEELRVEQLWFRNREMFCASYTRTRMTTSEKTVRVNGMKLFFVRLGQTIVVEDTNIHVTNSNSFSPRLNISSHFCFVFDCIFCFFSLSF